MAVFGHSGSHTPQLMHASVIFNAIFPPFFTYKWSLSLFTWRGRRELNPRSPTRQAGVLTRLNYDPPLGCFFHPPDLRYHRLGKPHCRRLSAEIGGQDLPVFYRPQYG